MTETFRFYAPNGAQIMGTDETVARRCNVIFYDEEGDEIGFDDDEVFWDTSDAKTIDGATQFLDENADEWLRHHLICETRFHRGEDDDFEFNGLSDATLTLIAQEFRLGAAVEAAKDLAGALKALGDQDGGDQLERMTAASHWIELQERYRAHRDRVKAAIAEELERITAAEVLAG